MIPISQVATMLHYHPRLVHLGWPDLSLVFESFQDPDMLVHGCPGQVKTWPDIIDFIKVQLSENSKQTFSTKAWIFWGHCHRGDYHFWGGQRFWLKLSYLFRLADTLVSASALTGDQTTGAPLLLAEGPVGHLQHHLLGPGQPQAHFESPPGKNNVPYMHQSHPFQFEEDVVPILRSLGPRLTTLTLYRLPDVDVLLIGELCPRLVLLRSTLHLNSCWAIWNQKNWFLQSRFSAITSFLPVFDLSQKSFPMLQVRHTIQSRQLWRVGDANHHGPQMHQYDI